jgi:hypothetical protein
MRHADYVIDKQRYVKHVAIVKKDKAYRIRNPGCKGRCMDFIQVQYNTLYTLINMDAFFELSQERKEMQLHLLKNALYSDKSPGDVI